MKLHPCILYPTFFSLACFLKPILYWTKLFPCILCILTTIFALLCPALNCQPLPAQPRHSRQPHLACLAHLICIARPARTALPTLPGLPGLNCLVSPDWTSWLVWPSMPGMIGLPCLTWHPVISVLSCRPARVALPGLPNLRCFAILVACPPELFCPPCLAYPSSPYWSALPGPPGLSYFPWTALPGLRS
jgi:hypothetical protein